MKPEHIIIGLLAWIFGMALSAYIVQTNQIGCPVIQEPSVYKLKFGDGLVRTFLVEGKKLYLASPLLTANDNGIVDVWEIRTGNKKKRK